MDPSGPLATLHKILLSEESIAYLRTFLESHWYTVVIVFAGVFFLMVNIVNCFYKNCSLTFLFPSY